MTCVVSVNYVKRSEPNLAAFIHMSSTSDFCLLMDYSREKDLQDYMPWEKKEDSEGQILRFK